MAADLVPPGCFGIPGRVRSDASSVFLQNDDRAAESNCGSRCGLVVRDTTRRGFG
jgi:hypothetical protein